MKTNKIWETTCDKGHKSYSGVNDKPMCLRQFCYEESKITGVFVRSEDENK